jgi:ABC-2 type transport system ATP-binding protein
VADALISTNAVTKRYGKVTALDRVDLSVTKGSVYGLVGPNGAGKTTMLGLLAGLRRPSDGSVSIDVATIGVLPDTPQFDRWLTGREVVDLARTLADNGTPPSAVDEMLEAAGLARDAHRKVRGYSRGMLQRLGLAATMVSQPEVLLLDEPAAALDPQGRREVLDLVSAMRGRATVLFSSHILTDVQAVSDEIGILRRGELVYQGSLETLLARYGGSHYTVHLRSGEAMIAESLRSQPWVRTVATLPNHQVVIDVTDVDAAEQALVPLLASGGHPVVSVVPGSKSLEEIFLEVTA